MPEKKATIRLNEDGFFSIALEWGDIAGGSEKTSLEEAFERAGDFFMAESPDKPLP